MVIRKGDKFLKRIGASRGKWVGRAQATVFAHPAVAAFWARQFWGVTEI